MKIFLVEDGEGVRGQIASLLGQVAGAQVVGFASTASEAIEGVRELLPDVVVLDLGLRLGVGQDVLRELKPLFGRVNFVVFTNSVDEVTVRHCIELGALAVLDKSTQIEQLFEVVNGLRKGEN